MGDPTTRLNAALEGRYRIESELGEGGMATVYLADDLKHGRKVALKVLKPELAAVVGAERFLAEIKTTATLHHPHILPLFDSGEADSFLFYVMPYVEGETLRDRLDREKQLPVEDALSITIAVAQALQHAHDRGVIHRDIKPGNILLQDGQPVVADFGIALAVGAAGGSRLTETGLSLGTPYYMSPEQATGDRQVGPASDTYSLAAVLYEMLVGDPPYTGSTAQAVLGKIIQGAPVSATELRRAVPVNVDAAIEKALEKLPADRFTDVRDFAGALSDSSFRYGTSAAQDPSGETRRWKRIAAGLAATTVLAAGWAGWGGVSPEPATTRPVVRVPDLFAGSATPPMPQGGFTLSPDGGSIVYRGRGEEGPSLFLRRLGESESSPLPGTEGGLFPLFSPDGESILFRTVGADGLATHIASTRGAVSYDLDAAGRFATAWGTDGYVYLSSQDDSATVRVPSLGGPSDTVIGGPVQGGVAFVVDVLPGAKMALGETRMDEDEGVVYLSTVDLSSGEVTLLPLQGEVPRYVETGHMVYLGLDSTLIVVPFDLDALQLTGSPVVVAQGVWDFWVSASGGTLLYRSPPKENANPTQLVWVSRSGQVTEVDPGWVFDRGDGNWGHSLSPDGSRIAFRELRNDNYDIFIKDLGTGQLSRLTFDEGYERMPRWADDGASLTFLSNRDGGSTRTVYKKSADGTGGVSPVFEHSVFLAQGFFDAAGEWLVLRTGGQGGVAGGRVILAVRPSTDSVATPLLTGEMDYSNPALSPDGRWLAYNSDPTGAPDVFVVPFPDVDSGIWQISDGGGTQPLWARNGRELFYVDSERRLISVRFAEGTGMVVSQTPLFTLPEEIVGLGVPNAGRYDVSPDGDRFLMARNAPVAEDEEEPDTDRYTLIVNFDVELKRLFGN